MSEAMLTNKLSRRLRGRILTLLGWVVGKVILWFDCVALCTDNPRV
jgi:hypothetical protein